MNIAFVWYWDRASETFPNWRDGLRAALDQLRLSGHSVDIYFDKKIPSGSSYDAIIFWDDSNSAFFNELDRYDCKKALCLTTDPQNFDNLRKLDAVYCESEPIYNAVRAQGIRAIKAFGTDSNFFTPDETKKDIEYFYPATFSPWKNQKSITYLGPKLTCLGTIQPDGQEEYDACVKNGVDVKVGYYPADYIRDLYRRAKNVIIPAVHGSERTVLEAMSMNIPIKVTGTTNLKVQFLINEEIASRLNKKTKTAREFVLQNYSPEIYAKNILKGIS